LFKGVGESERWRFSGFSAIRPGRVFSFERGTHPPIHPSTHSPTHPSTHPPIHPSTHPPIHPSTHPPIHPLTHSPTHLFTHSPIHPFTYSPIHPFTHSPIHPSTHSPIHPLTYSPIHPFTYSPVVHLSTLDYSFLSLCFLPRNTSLIGVLSRPKLSRNLLIRNRSYEKWMPAGLLQNRTNIGGRVPVCVP